MKKILRWVLLVIGGLVGLVLLMTLIGVFLPKDHVAARTLTLPQTPEAVWQVITDFAQQPQWFSEVSRAERLPDQNGRARWRETFGGDMEATLEVTEENPPQRLVRKLVGDDLPFGGQWEYEIKPLASGSQITVTERGFVNNPFFRFMSRFVFGHSATIEKYLQSLAAKFGAPAQISE
jgi:uncharacterized protein YndB with AHSA1/START domain